MSEVTGVAELTFGSWLKQRRKNLGITQEALAERIDVSLIMLRKLEAGTRKPSGQVASLLADYLNVSPGEREAFITFARSGQPSTTGDNFAEDSPSTAAFPQAPWRSAHLQRTNLPSLLTPIIGRELDQAKIREHLLNSKVRLLTLTGAPGIGKTSLALQVASDLVDSDYFPDGVFLVELAPVLEPAMVPAVIARALDQKEGELPAEEALLRYLRERRMLILLDNFEQVLDAAVGVIRLLEGCPWLKVLITSREALHVKGERRYSVPPLALPDEQALPPLNQLIRYPSVELFVEHARVVQPDFVLTDQNAPAVASICVRLDGLPLAIELAAGHVSLLSPQEIEGRMNSRLQLLKTRARGLPDRQRTLRGAIDWSYNLLGEREQALFRRVGVFVDAWSVEAARAVSGAEDKSNAGLPDIVEELETLLDKSLITRVEQPNNAARAQSSGGSEQRLGLLETLREYALELLVAHGEEESTRDRHAQYYLTFVQQTDDVLLHEEKYIAWLNKLEAQYNNIRESLAWLLGGHADTNQKELERLDIAAQFCTSLFLFWDRQTYLSEAQSWYVKTAERIADLVGAQSGGEESISAAMKLSADLPATWARMLTGAGAMSYYMCDLDEARTLNEQGMAMRRALGDTSGVAACLNNLGNVAGAQGDFEAARSYLSESVAIARQLDIPWKISAALNNLGAVETNLGNFEEARVLLEECLAICKAADMQVGSNGLINLAVVARFQGDFASSRKYLDEALDIDNKAGHQAGVAQAFINLGLIARDEGDNKAALDYFLEGLQVSRDVGDRKGSTEYLEAFASLAVETGDASRAAKLYGAATAIRVALKSPIVPVEEKLHDSYQQTARSQLGESAWRAAWNEGSAMSLEEAIDYAIGA